MSEPSPSSSSPASRFLIAAAVLAAAGVAMAVASYGGSGEATAAPGAPLYDRTVKEAIRGLKGLGKQPKTTPVAKRPPLPAGLNPKDYYWCEKCKAYHPRKPQAGKTPAQPAAAVPHGPAGGAPPARKAAVPPGQPQTRTAPPPLPAGLDPKNYYWCEKCKAYHLRKKPGSGKAGGVTPGTSPHPGTRPAPKPKSENSALGRQKSGSAGQAP